MILNSDKIKLDVLEVAGIKPAIMGMRNPMDSWDKSDTKQYSSDFITIGDADMQLAQTLIRGGSEHRKFLRQIQVWFDLTVPRYIWSEFDTYGFTVKNSCSTMHKLFRKDKLISTDQFVYNEDDQEVMDLIVAELNTLRQWYFSGITAEEQDKILRRAKMLLPEGLLQKRTVCTNYETLRNIVHQRKNHRLPEWHYICDEIGKLPYAKEFILYNN